MAHFSVLIPAAFVPRLYFRPMDDGPRQDGHREVLHRIASGEREALRLLYDTFKTRVFNTALSYVREASDAEEVTQDVFVDIWKGAAKFGGASQVSTWIYRITVNRSLDVLRHRRRKKRTATILRLFNPQSGKLEHDASDFIHPGIELERQEEAKYLFAAIDELPDKQKTAFVLSIIEDLPQKEVADIMGLTVGAVESLLQRAKGNLRKVIERP
jgi:RNA polymerase sigma factor (sigma-70 family)